MMSMDAYATIARRGGKETSLRARASPRFTVQQISGHVLARSHERKRSGDNCVMGIEAHLAVFSVF